MNRHTFTYICGHTDSLRLRASMAWTKRFIEAESKKPCVECRFQAQIKERAEERKRRREQEREERQKARDECNKKEEK